LFRQKLFFGSARVVVAGGESSRGFSSERACSILAVDHKRLVARRAIERKAEWIIPEQSRTYDPGGCTTGLFDHRSISRIDF
jgi:hypothetical protein